MEGATQSSVESWGDDFNVQQLVELVLQLYIQ
jgi:hypothetical protein